MFVDKKSKGLETFKIGTWDAERNDLGFVTQDIRKATHRWGGLKFDSMDCTQWCQRYTTCTACLSDSSCTFSATHGNCIAADAYIYDYGCSRPSEAPEVKVLNRDGYAYRRESALDGFDATAVL